MLLLIMWCGLTLSMADKPSLDWKDEESATNQLYKGLIIQAYQTNDGQPTIAMGSEYDDFEQVYCLNLLGLFQSNNYNLTSGEYDILSDSYTNFTNCSLTEQSTTEFEVICDVNDATLNLSFTFTTDSNGDNGLEYIITLKGYELATNTTKLIIVQSLEDCSNKYDIDTSESEESEESADSEDSNDEEEVSSDRRRRLESDDDESQSDDEEEESDESESSEDGDSDSSSSDSDEVDVGLSRFVSSGQALDQCEENTTNIESALVVQSNVNQVHLVFDYFQCDLVLDPFVGLDDSKYAELFGSQSNAQSIWFINAFIVCLIAIII